MLKSAISRTIVDIDEINSVNAYTDRVKKRKEANRVQEGYLCPERSRLYTQSWKETEGLPVVLRKAKAFQRVLEGIPVIIKDGELIVGSQTTYARGCNAYPEFLTGAFLRQLESGVLYSDMTLPTRMSKEDSRVLLEDCLYWKERSVEAQILKVVNELWGKKFHDEVEAGLWLHNWTSPPFATNVNWDRLIRTGLRGVIEEAKEELRRLGIPNTFDELNKYYFLQAVIIVNEAVITYAGRYARLAGELAQKEPDRARKTELEEIAEICDRLPENPALTFREALQSFWFVFLAQYFDAIMLAVAPGRFDQYMFPLYRADIEEGRMTRQQAAELIGCLLVKIDEIEFFKERETLAVFGPSSQLQNLTIGGVKADGSDATNELSLLLLEAARQVKTRQPHISLRYHDGLSQEFLIKAVETNRDIGAGIPAYFNDKKAMLELARYGIPIEEVRNWIPIGCMQRFTAGSSFKLKQAWINVPKCFELALNSGIDPRTGKQIGLRTGDPLNFASADELYEAFKKQYSAALKTALDVWRTSTMVITQNYRLPFTSSLIDGCIKNGKDVYEYGIRFPQITPFITTLGYQNVADSITAIRKLVFEDKVISMVELLDALAVNFEGKEDLRRKLLDAPKYGNDDDYADAIMKDMFKWDVDEAAKHKDAYGYPVRLNRQGLGFHVLFGKKVGALPDGRKAWDVLADGSLSAMRGADKNGPTAVINSAAKVSCVEDTSALFNLRINPSAVRTREGILKFLAMLKSFFDRYGYMVQVNMVNQETLLEAKKHPENYRDLLVRVAGFSAYFVELPPEIQDEIIARTEHGL